MPRLIINNFSCIESAEIELGDLTILIGPQASGKSVISKLIYFAYDVFSKQYRYIEDEHPISEFVKVLEADFGKVFPPIAWGRGRFEIHFIAGMFEIKISGMGVTGNASSRRARVKVSISDYFKSSYEDLLQQMQSSKIKPSKGPRKVYPFEHIWRIRETAERRLRSDLKSEYFGNQLFIPAGRSFFTSVGKAIAVFEHGGILDPITVEFGRLYAALRDRSHVTFDYSARQSARSRSLMQKFFGGSIEFVRDDAFVKAPDGRRVPFAFLSSGQQELLPLWLAVSGYHLFGNSNTLIFIEEPEAHLFPSSQADVTRYLATLIAAQKAKSKLVITTHSPYVLASVNNLVKAGDMALMFKNGALGEIEKIVPKESWLLSGRIRAYALKDGRAFSIFEDGLIDANYIDEVSGEIASQFSELLEIERRYATQ